jgi:hypothetical protein
VKHVVVVVGGGGWWWYVSILSFVNGSRLEFQNNTIPSQYYTIEWYVVQTVHPIQYIWSCLFDGDIPDRKRIVVVTGVMVIDEKK